MRRLALLCAPLVGCLAATPIDWPFTGNGPQLLVLEDAAGGIEATVVRPGRATLLVPPGGATLYALSYDRPLEELNLPLQGDRIVLAAEGTPPESARPLPGRYQALRYAAESGWSAVPASSALDRLRLRYPACPTVEAESLILLDTHQDLRALLPFPSGKLFALTSAGEHEGGVFEVMQVYEVGSSTITRRPDVERALALASSATVTNPIAFQLRGEHHLVLDDGAIVRIDDRGALTPVHPGLRFASPSPLAGIAARETGGQLEAFALTLALNGASAPGELYYLAPGAANWKATGFSRGEYRGDCGLWQFASLSIEPGRARFAYRRAMAYEYDDATGRFGAEQIEAPPDDYCRTWLLDSPRFGRLAILDEPGISARGYVSRRGASGWVRLGAVDGISGRGLFELGGELFAYSNHGGFRALRIFEAQDGPATLYGCPSELGASAETNLAITVGDQVYFETKQAERLAIGRATVTVHD